MRTATVPHPMERIMKNALDGTFMRYNRNTDTFAIEGVPKAFNGDYYTGTGSSDDKRAEALGRDDPQGLQRIARVVKTVTGIGIDQMIERNIAADVSFARRLFCYLAHKHSAASNVCIGRFIDRYSDFVSSSAAGIKFRHLNSVAVLRAEDLLTRVLA